MATAEKIRALRGMQDVFSAEFANRRQILAALEEHLRSHAYLSIDLPILENTELFLRKSGEDIASRLYEFNYRSRRVALRPEMTASVLRAYVEHLQDAPLPLRVQFAGPVFRYEKPQQNRFRQFTVAGAELLGAAGTIADAEVIHLACSGIEQLGVRQYKLVVGHTEILEGFLRSLGLRKQLLNFLLRNMENIRKRGMASVNESISELFPDLAADAAMIGSSGDSEQVKSQQLIAVLREMSDDEAHQAITDFLRSLNIRIDTNRDTDEVIDRLLHKIREDAQAPKLRMALDYMRKLSELVGSPQQVLQQARALVVEYDMNPNALNMLERTLDQLDLFGQLDAEIELDFGLNRGLHYYTGLMFEIHYTTENGEDIQLCGGGRYDNLISVLGGSDTTPALGFAYGIERIASVLDRMGKNETRSLGRPDVYMIPVGETDFPFSFEQAKTLRRRGLVVEVAIDDRNLRRSLKHADRKGAALVIISGEREREQGKLVLRDMRNHREAQVSVEDMPAEVERLLADHE